MKAKEVRNLNDEQLLEKARELKEDLLGLRFQNATGELENTSRLREARQTLARTLTIARERRLRVERELRKQGGV